VTVNLLTKLAWRNILRNKRRSLLTVLAVTFAALLSIAMRGMQVGTYAVNIQNVVGMFSGYCQIQREGYNTNPTLQTNFAYSEELMQVLRADPRIRAAAPRIIADGLAAHGQTSVGVMILGVDVGLEGGVTTLLERVRTGAPPRPGDTPLVVLGQTLAKNLGARIGDDIVLLAQGADGTLGNMKYRVSGLAKSGSPDLDRAAVIMDLADAQALLTMEGRIHAVAIALRDLKDLPAVTSDLRTRLNDISPGPPLAILSWEELLPEFRQHIQMDNVSGILFLGILIIIVAFGILNTVLMSVTERYREFGVTLAMGMSPARLVLVVILEGILLGVVGLVLGNVLAFAVNAYIVVNPIYIGGDISSIYEEYGFLPALYSSVRPHIFLNSSLAILGITVLSCLYPAYRVWHLSPIEGMRHV
jgi:putative ABC transport system permease protein